MLKASDFISRAAARGHSFYSGVPCSFLTPLINAVIAGDGVDYVGATGEGEAVAVAAGAWLAGRRTVVMGQNSGLGNMVNPLTSLNYPFRIPTLLVVTWRGQPGLRDEPQHELMGHITGGTFDLMKIASRVLPDDRAGLEACLDEAAGWMSRTGLPFALIVPKATFAATGLDEPAPPVHPRGVAEYTAQGGPPAPRIAVLERLLGCLPDTAAVIASTGKCGRELHHLADREQHFYLVGSMGCAAALGLGVALNALRPVVVLDGDGAVLMRLGTLATIGARAPENLLHIVLDNGVHDSTGGQRTDSAQVDFVRLAQACGYAYAASCSDLAVVEALVTNALRRRGPVLLHVRIAPGSLATLGRPDVGPRAVAERFAAFLGRRPVRLPAPASGDIAAATP